MTTDQESEFQRLAYLELATGKHSYLSSHIPWDVDSYDLSPDGRTIAFVTNEEGLGVLRLLDTASGKEKPAPKLPIGLVFGIEWHENGRDLGLVLSAARSPSDVYSIDVASGTLERWTESETGGLNAASFSEPELVRWKSFDGKTISGFLYKPASRFSGPASGRGQHPRRARGPVAPGLPGPQQLLPGRAGRGRAVPERARLDGLRQELRQARQRRAARGLGEGHRRAARLDPDAQGPRRVARDGDRRQLRRLHDARGGDALRREAALRARRRRDLELRDVPAEHRVLPARPAPRRVRRRAGSRR